MVCTSTYASVLRVRVHRCLFVHRPWFLFIHGTRLSYITSPRYPAYLHKQRRRNPDLCLGPSRQIDALIAGIVRAEGKCHGPNTLSPNCCSGIRWAGSASLAAFRVSYTVFVPSALIRPALISLKLGFTASLDPVLLGAYALDQLSCSARGNKCCPPRHPQGW